MIYKCSVCGREYDTMDECQACEKYHEKVIAHSKLVVLNKDITGWHFNVEDISHIEVSHRLKNVGLDCVLQVKQEKSITITWSVLSEPRLVSQAKKKLYQRAVSELKARRDDLRKLANDINNQLKMLVYSYNREKEIRDAEH